MPPRRLAAATLLLLALTLAAASRPAHARSASAVGHCRAYSFLDRAGNGHGVYAISTRSTSCTSVHKLAGAAWRSSPNAFHYHGFSCTAKSSPSGTPNVSYACKSGSHRARFKIS